MIESLAFAVVAIALGMPFLIQLLWVHLTSQTAVELLSPACAFNTCANSDEVARAG